MSYKSRVHLTNVRPINSDIMSLVYEAMWRTNTASGMAASGYTCLKNNAKVFTSSNIIDVTLALSNECWDTKKLFTGVKPGDKIYILPSRSLFESGKSAFGMEATATTEMLRLDSNSIQSTWLLDSEETTDGAITIIGKSTLQYT
jgi:hypothetical protein